MEEKKKMLKVRCTMKSYTDTQVDAIYKAMKKSVRVLPSYRQPETITAIGRPEQEAMILVFEGLGLIAPDYHHYHLYAFSGKEGDVTALTSTDALKQGAKLLGCEKEQIILSKKEVAA